MSFTAMQTPPPPAPEPYVNSAAVRAYLGGVSAHTLNIWLANGLPCRRVPTQARGGRLMFKLSEVDAWLRDYQSNRTANPPGDNGDIEGVDVA